MATGDLDPLFVKALKLLQSRSKESKEQLRQLYEEVAAQRKAEIVTKRVGFEIHIWHWIVLVFYVSVADNIAC